MILNSTTMIGALDNNVVETFLIIILNFIYVYQWGLLKV
jgi:hypothetical protein